MSRDTGTRPFEDVIGEHGKRIINHDLVQRAVLITFSILAGWCILDCQNMIF